MDARASLRTVDEFLWVLRRNGIVVSTAEAIATARALAAVPWRHETVKEVFVATLARTSRDADRIRRHFGEFFGAASPARDIFERLSRKGATPEEIDLLRNLVTEATRTWAEGGAHFDHAVHQGVHASGLFTLASPLQLGFYAKTLSHKLGATQARDDLALLAPALRDAFGAERAALLLTMMDEEIRSQETFVRSALAELSALQDSTPSQKDAVPFASLDPAEYDRARLAVRSFAKRLGGGARTRARRRSKGTIDLRRTLRASFRTGGVPMALCHRRRARQRPKLWILCDISDSVRAASTFILEFACAAQELFAKTRSFVFVSELAEATSLFDRHRSQPALAIAEAGRLVAGTHNSNYGHVLRSLLERHGRELDDRTTVVILGDGRTNYLSPEVSALAEIQKSARAIYWLAPESMARWASGDSALGAYRPHVTRMLSVTSVTDLERAARLLLAKT
ncbi:MAG: VWA domain-containing protein [Polyangiaceae bacterium]